MVPFTVIREYELFTGDDREPKGTVIVKVHFQPPTTETWEINKTSGGDRAEKVVKRLLENEVKNAKDGNLALTSERYDFFYAGIGEANRRPCHILQVVPKRDDSNLIRGRIWVDRDTYLIHRFEGEPARSPSWWIKSLKLFRSYGDWGGIWLPTNSEGVADVRLFGQHTMTERVLSYRAARTVFEGPTAELARLRFRQPGPSLLRPTPAATAAGISVVTAR
jgi:hypothetical protein